MSDTQPHFAILGSGPTGLEAALAAQQAQCSFTVFESSPSVAGQMAAWGHVQLFTPWSMNVSSRMRKALAAHGLTAPDGAICPTGRELIDQVIAPLFDQPGLAENLELGQRVVAVGRQGLLKHEEIGSANRGSRPFRLLIEDVDGQQSVAYADVVLDCTGKTEANAVGDGGIAAPGEVASASWIVHEVPDLASEGDQWAGRKIMLLGAGHSAQTALRDLVELAESHPGTVICWARRSLDTALGYVEDDALPQRCALTGRAQQLLADPPACLQVRGGVVVESLRPAGERLQVSLRHGDGRIEQVDVDRLLALTGNVGDHQLYRQLQIHECYATSGPMKLAAALLGASGGGDCLAQTSLGPDTLKNPEPGFFILGSKSYGRRNDFLMRVGWQQVDETFQLLRNAA